MPLNPLQTRLSALGELLLVTILGFGLSIYSSTLSIIELSQGDVTKEFTSASFYFLTISQLIKLSLIAWLLHSRNWTLRDFHLDFAFYMIGIALLLILLRVAIGFTLTFTLNITHILTPTLAREPTATYDMSLFSIFLVLVVNSIYEEVLLIGYYFKRLENYHPAVAITLSLIIRASYHTYQGWGNAPMIAAMALAFGLYYIKYKKLWPLILAHGIGNAIVLLREYSNSKL